MVTTSKTTLVIALHWLDWLLDGDSWPIYICAFDLDLLTANFMRIKINKNIFCVLFSGHSRIRGQLNLGDP